MLNGEKQLQKYFSPDPILFINIPICFTTFAEILILWIRE
jgi:hypothetical protein